MVRQGVTLEIGSESESVSPKQHARERIQGVTLSPLKNMLRKFLQSHLPQYLYVIARPHLARMNYNELKIHILGLFEPTQEFDSLKIRELLSTDWTLKLTDKAVEMALLRYWRQGLLSRTRRAGRFQYALTERGLARKEWLLKNG